MTKSFFLYAYRQQTSAAASVGLGLVIASISSLTLLPLPQEQARTVELSLIAPPPKVVQPETLPVLKPAKPLAKTPVKRSQPEQVRPSPKPPAPEPPPNLSADASAPQQQADIRADRITAELPKEVVPTQPVLQKKQASTISLEGAYENELKNLLEEKKTYPTSRQASIERPEGAVEVCMSLNRKGELVTSELVSRSGSIILDRSAQRLVSSLSYPAFPAGAFEGESQRRFCVVLEYRRK